MSVLNLLQKFKIPLYWSGVYVRFIELMVIYGYPKQIMFIAIKLNVELNLKVI